MKRMIRVTWARALGMALTASLCLGSATHSSAQLPTSAPPPQKTEPTTLVDPLGRETPRSALIGFLKYEQLENYATAARYFQPTPGHQKTNLVQVAKEAQAFGQWFKGSIALLSDDPNGIPEPGLPPDQVRAGVLTVGSATSDVILVRVDDPTSGKIWLISKDTVANIPKLNAQFESQRPTAVDRIVPVALKSRRLLGISLAQWLGWLLSIPISWLLTWLLTLLLSAPRRVWYGLQKVPFRTVWQTPLGMPLRCITAILMHSAFVYLLEPPLLYRVYYARFLAALLMGCVVWLVTRLADRGFDVAVTRTRTQGRGGDSILVMMQRLTHVVLLIVVLVAALALFGFNVKTTLAGLGIGGLAIALAAQKTLENLIGGVSLLMDKVVRVGDFCQIGDQLGTVEDIGLRSLRLRTLDGNLSVVPNGSLAQMQFVNMARRSKLLINQKFSLRIETQAEQLRHVLDHVQSMLNEHPRIEVGTSRVRVADFAGAAFDLELFAYGKTGDWTEFTAIRQDVILNIAQIVEAAGTRLAAPTQLTYLCNDPGVDVETAKRVARQLTEVRANDAFQIPGKART
jgi:MscS family membrane protein